MIGEAVANALKDASYAVDWVGAELDRPRYAAELFRGRFRRGGDASGIAPFRWEEIGPSSRRRFGPAAGIPRKCNKSQFTPPVAARLVLETNVRSGLCVTEDHHAALSQVHLHKDSAAGDRI